MLGPFATASRRTPIHQVSLPVLSHAACASMSTCPRRRQRQRQRVTEGTAMAPQNGPNNITYSFNTSCPTQPYKIKLMANWHTRRTSRSSIARPVCCCCKSERLIFHHAGDWLASEYSKPSNWSAAKRMKLRYRQLLCWFEYTTGVSALGEKE